MSLKDKYPNMYKEPWDGIVDGPDCQWKNWSSDNYMVKSTHEMFEVLYSNGYITTEMHNDLKNKIKYVEMDKKFVDKIIDDFNDLKETISATIIQSKIRMYLQRTLYLEILSLKPGGTGYLKVKKEFSSLVSGKEEN